MQILNDACIQTLGLEEPENASLRHINGKLQITKSSNGTMSLNNTQNLRLGGYSNGHYLNNSFTNNQNSNNNSFFNSTDNISKLLNQNKSPFNMVDISIDDNMDCNIKPNANLLCVSNNNNNDYQQSNSFSSGSNFQLRQPIIKMPPHLQQQQQQPQNNYQKVPMLDFSFKPTNNQPMKTTMPAYMQPNTSSPQYQPNQYQKSHDNYNHGDNLVGYRPNNFLKNPSQPESYYRRLNQNGIEEHQAYNHLNQYKLDGLHPNNNYQQQNSPKNYNNNQYQQNYNENNYSSGQQHLKFSPKLNSDHKFYQPKPLSNPTRLNVNAEATRRPDLIFENSNQEYTVEEIQNQVDYYYEKSFKNLTKNEADLKESNSKTELLVVKTEDETRLTSHLRSQTVETIDLNGHRTRENDEELHQSAYHHHSRNPAAESPHQQQQQTPVAQVRSRRSSLSSTTMPNCFSIATADINIDVDCVVDSEKTDSSSTPHRPFTKPRVSNINPLSYYETRVKKNEPELIVSPVVKEEETSTVEEVMNSMPSAKPRLKPNQLNETTKLIQELSDASDEGIQMSSDINDSEKINEEKVEKKARTSVAKPRSKSTPNPLPKPRNSVRLDNEKYNSDDETDSNEAGYCEENLDDDDYKHDDQLNYIDTSTSTISSEHNVKPNHPRQAHVVNQSLVDNNQHFISSDNSIDITDLPKKSAKFTTENDVRKKLDLNLASCLNRNNYTSPAYTMNPNSEKKSNTISSSTSSSSRSSELEPSLSPRSESGSSSSQHAVSNSSSTVSSPSHSTSNFSQQSSQHFKSAVHSPNKQLNNINEIEPSQNTSSGVVNQIKNMFEVAKPHRNDILLSPSPAKPALRKFNIAASPTTTKQEITTPKLQAKRVEEEEKPEYMNLSNNYIAKARPKETKREALPPPPTSPPLPPTQPPISPNYKINHFEIESLQSSPTKHVKQSSPTKQTAKTTENLVSKLISDSPISQQRPKHAPINIQTELNSDTLNHHQAKSSPLASTAGHTSRQQRQMSSASSNTNYTLQSVKITPTASTSGGALNNTEFRMLNAHSSERSTTPSGKSSNTSMANIVDRRVMIRHIPEAVDEVKLDFEGQRRVVVPGYMTSADILRNMLLNNANNAANMGVANGTDLKTAAPMIIKRQQQNGMSLKEKLLMQKRIEAGENVDDLNHQYRDDSLLSTSRHKQNYSMAQMNPSLRFNGNLTTQQHMSKSIHFNEAHRNGFNRDPAANLKSAPCNEDDDPELALKFRSNRTRSMSGVITINTTSTQIIDINLDYETAPAPAPNQAAQPAPQIKTKVEESIIIQPPVREELKAAPRHAAKMSNEQKIFQSINQPIIYAPVPPPPPPPPAPAQQNKSLEIASYSISTQKPQESLPVVAQAPRATKQLDPENHYAVSHIIADNPVQTKFSTVEQQQQIELRTSSVKNSINGSRRIAKQSVTGSFDPNDFDSFDEEEEEANSVSKRSTRSLMRNQAQINARVPNHVQIESIEKIRESAMIHNVEIEPEQEQQQQQQQQQQGMGPCVESSNLNAVQFDPDYFDSFDEDESDTEKRTSSPINAQLPVIQLSPKNIETQTQHANSNRSSEEPEMDEQKKRQSEFIANRNKLEEIFKRNAVFNAQTKPKEPIKEKPVVKTTPATNTTDNHPRINLSDLNTHETSGFNAEFSSQINSSTNYNDNVSNYSNERHNNNTVTSPKLNSKLNNFIEEAEEDPPQSHSSNFFRSALDRLSNRNSKKSKSKSRSSSVPLRTLIANELKASANISIEQDECAEQEVEMGRKTQRSTTLQHEETNVAKNFGSTTLPASQSGLPNMKALHLMTKMQNEFEEKQKRKKQRREQQKLLEEQKKQNAELNKSQSEIKTPKSERKFLTSIINTLFSTSSNNEASAASNETNFQKNEAKRLSLRKLKAKDKAKRKGDDGEPNAGDKDQDYQSDGEINNSKKFNLKKASNQSLNIIMNYQNDDFDNEDDVVEHTDEFKLKSTVDEATHNNIMPSTSKLHARFGKIKNETKEETPINPNNKENIMKQLKAELDEEIKDRRLIELKENIINGGCESSGSGGSTNSGASAVISNYDDNYAKNPKSSTLNRRRNNANFENNGDDLDKKNRKNRSKSVTFLDEISTDDEQLAHSPNNYQKRPMDFTGLDKNYTTNNVSSPQIQPRTSTSNNGYYEDNEESNNHLVTPSSNRRSLKNGDARLYAGALTGVGPIRSIMKKSATDLAISVNMNSTNYDDSEGVNSNEAANYLPNVQMGAYEQDYNRMPKSQTTPNLSAKKKQLIQSDL